jgi:class 3 adenylate cyclase/tetratricopeptide (TPR) repeat protein
VAVCASCGAGNPADKRFCGDCGSPLVSVCASCGSTHPPGTRFCGDCGAPLAAATPIAALPAAERRVVSVLFVDLVGFTSASEGRDAEETRELLTRYFEMSRRTVERYGGTVEKFIGDAVMALWGAPVAQEDDVERAVRAALELVAAGPGLDPALQARAGVLSGEAAVTVGAHGQGMVAGDIVNTASRIQSAAEPGTVLVGDSTKRASEAAVAYDDAGEHLLKGKAEAVRLWRALRVVAGARGMHRTGGLEAPFVGRDRELRLVKELFHDAADARRAQLAVVTGIAGSGKSRLGWEFEKYVDGIADETFWHYGRCLSYGEGVAYWALAEMVRERCGIHEDEVPEAARGKLTAALREYLPDADERTWVEPRLAHLLGLEEGVPGDQENLFSAWRILFERLADRSPTILVFEDLQWADSGLLDFLEYLLDWSRDHPLFVLGLARPDFSDKRPGWGSGKRSFSSLYLESLSPAAMRALLAGLVPGLPEDLQARILDRAEGVPLYAVETVRMLLDRGLLTRDGNAYRTTGAIEDLEVPETLHALVAARLDALPPEERRLVGCGAVLGKNFTKQGLAAVSGMAEAELEALLADLLAKDLVSVQADPRSPERGQYSFLQDIVKRIAYETLSRRERKAKHLAAAEHLASTWTTEEDETTEVVAAHYLDAYRAAPDDPDAAELRSKAFEMLVRAAERAASLGANAEAQRTFERAGELTDDVLARAELHERAGVMASVGGRLDDAAANFERAIELFDSAGASHPAARVSARVAEISWERGRLELGLEDMDRAFATLSEEEPDADLAALAAQIGRFRFFAGQPDVAMERLERALSIAERLQLPETLAHALNTKGLVLFTRGRKTEGSALVSKALAIALEQEKPSAALRACYNLADLKGQLDAAQEAAELARDGLALARRVGSRYWEYSFLGLAYPSYVLGDWDAVVAREAGLPEEDWAQARIAFGALLDGVVPVRVHRGQHDEAQQSARHFAELAASADVQEQGQVHLAQATLLLAAGQHAEALRSAELALGTRAVMGVGSASVREAIVVALDAALALDDLARVDELLADLDALPPGDSPVFLTAHRTRFAARLAVRREDLAGAEQLFARATQLFRDLAYPFPLAMTLLEHAESLLVGGLRVDAAPLLAEAESLFARLDAKPWLERTARAAEASDPTRQA